MKKTADRCAAPYTENNPGAAMPGVCFLLPYRCATAQRRSNGAASAAMDNPPAPITAAPPYCYLVPGVTPEAAALADTKNTMAEPRRCCSPCKPGSAAKHDHRGGRFKSLDAFAPRPVGPLFLQRREISEGGYQRGYSGKMVGSAHEG